MSINVTQTDGELPKTLPDGKFYMIRRKTDGLFSHGGSWIYFSKTGKPWPRLSSVNAHLNSYFKYRKFMNKDGTINHDLYFGGDNPYIDCEIVVCEYIYADATDIYRHVAIRSIKSKKKTKK